MHSVYPRSVVPGSWPEYTWVGSLAGAGTQQACCSYYSNPSVCSGMKELRHEQAGLVQQELQGVGQEVVQTEEVQGAGFAAMSNEKHL